MNEDVMSRASTIINALHRRALALAHPNQDTDMGIVLQAMAINLEMQREIARDLTQIAERLSRLE